MTTPDDVSLVQACESFAVANTPLFLLRKLREDPAIAEIARSFTADQILAALASAVERDPAELLNAVRPYAYLVALSKQPSDSGLRAASSLDAKKWAWFSYLSKVLIESFSPVLRQEISISQPPAVSIQPNFPARPVIISNR